MSENDSVLVSHFGSDDVSKFQPAEASYQIHEAWEESGSPGSEARFGVFAVSSLFADSFVFCFGCFHHVFFCSLLGRVGVVMVRMCRMCNNINLW